MTEPESYRRRFSKDCPRGCGRRCDRQASQCRACRFGEPPVPAKTSTRCATKDCGVCSACRTRKMWRDGVFANAVRVCQWTPEEDALLHFMAGRFTTRAIAAEFKRLGFERTHPAIKDRAVKLDISLECETWTLRQVRLLFGIPSRPSSRGCFMPDVLHARHLPPGEGNGAGLWHIEEADLERFIRECPWEYDPAMMRPASHRLVQLAHKVHRHDPWVTLDQAAAYLGLSTGRVAWWCAEGVIPARKRRINAGVRSVRWVIRAADLPMAQAAIEVRRAQANADRRFRIRPFGFRGNQEAAA